MGLQHDKQEITKEIQALELRLDHKFAQPDLLISALTHPSMGWSGNRQKAQKPEIDYQRLEFLGDRVLGLCIAELLYHNFPAANEGELARRLNNLVCRETCADIGKELGLANAAITRLNPEELSGRAGLSLLADICEAVIAAIYLDAGMDAAHSFVGRHWHGLLNQKDSAVRDAKTRLQEWAQGRALSLPSYRLVERRGPDHAPRFEICVMVEGAVRESGHGPSRRDAEQAAAQRALQALGLAEPGDKPAEHQNDECGKDFHNV